MTKLSKLNLELPGDCRLKFNICPNCLWKSKFKLKNNTDNADPKEKRYYCKICCQTFCNTGAKNGFG